MAVKGLTTKKDFVVSRGAPKLGKLFKGAPKTPKRPGKDLDYFRVEFEPQYRPLAAVFEKMFGEKPDRFDVKLIGDTVDQVFPTYFEQWNHHTMEHRCDGEEQHRWYDKKAKQYSSDPIPCAKLNADGCRCKLVGRLAFVIPTFNDVTRQIGSFTIETHSINDIQELFHPLSFLHTVFGTLNFVPVTLGRAPKEHSWQNDKGDRGRKTSSLLYVNFDADMLNEYMNPALPAPPAAVAQLPAGASVPEDMLALPETTNAAADVVIDEPGPTPVGEYPPIVHEDATFIDESAPPIENNGPVLGGVWNAELIATWIYNKLPDLDRGRVVEILELQFDPAENKYIPTREQVLATILIDWGKTFEASDQTLSQMAEKCLGKNYVKAVMLEMDKLTLKE